MKETMKVLGVILVFNAALLAICISLGGFLSRAEAAPPPPEASIVRALEANTRALEGIARHLDRINDTLRECGR